MTDRQPAIDLTRYAFKRELGEMTLFGTWLWNEDKENTEPALVLVPTFRLNGAVPCCIALSAAYKYNEARYAVRAARHFSTQMGFEDSMTRTHKIATIIHDHLIDLIKMPVDPRTSAVIGEAIVDDGSGRKRTVELLEHEQTPQA